MQGRPLRLADAEGRPAIATTELPIPAGAAAWRLRRLDRGGSFTAVLALFLVCTGASGLIYQLVWFRVLGLVFGVTVHATSAVLAAFMAGLALGSFAAGRVADRTANPLRLYGMVEILIGAFGLFSLVALELLLPVYRALAASVTDSLVVLSGVRFFLAFAVMLVPTTLMGATLPLVVKSSLARSSALSQNVSLLYAFNTFGAIAGAYLAGFYLIGLYGTAVTTAIAAGLNLLVGMLSVALATATFSAAPQAPGRTVTPHAPHEPVAAARYSAGVARVVLVTYALSGCIALAYEVVWTRVLASLFPQTVYAFALMLCAILAGIAAGSWAVNGVIGRRWNWPLAFVALEVLMGIVAALSVTVLSRFYGFEALLRQMMGTTRLLSDETWFMTIFAFLTISPTAFLMGVTFPVAAKIYATGYAEVGRRIGTLYGANVLGAIAGSLLAGLALIPALGSQRSMWLLAAGNVVLAIAVLVALPRAPVAGRLAGVADLALAVTRRVKLAIAGVAAALLGGAMALTPDMYERLFRTHPAGEQVLWYHEGDDATVKVVRRPGGNLLLYVNSQGQATDTGSGLNLHRALGHLPVLIHPSPRDVLVVGLGGGATAGAVAAHQRVSLTVAELHAGVVEGARFFQHVNYGVLDRPNVRITLADGRNHLLVAGRRYDLIQGDIIPPQNAGASNLYSVEYYRLARAALKEGGLLVQWMDRSLPEYQYKMLIRTFLTVFPHATLWADGYAIVGSVEPLRIDPAAIRQKYEYLDTMPDLRLHEITLASVEDVLRHQFVAQSHELAAYVGPGPVITDRHPAIEYSGVLPGGPRASLDRFSRDIAPLLR